jgi:glyoxylase-like metal-dependent hydrolase (beta-lactamase superfamily II)
MIVEKIEVGPLATNCYIVGSGPGREGMIIDPGGEAQLILNKISDLKLEVKLIVLTHGHMDHVGALREVKEASGADIVAHADDVKTLGDGSLSVLLGISPSALPPPDRLLEDGDKIDIGNLNFIVRHTPGHSPDSICLLGEGVVFSGDTLFNYGIGRADLPGGNPSQLMDSIRTKLMVLADNMVVYPGHGPKTTIGAERRGNPFLQD